MIHEVIQNVTMSWSFALFGLFLVRFAAHQHSTSHISPKMHAIPQNCISLWFWVTKFSQKSRCLSIGLCVRLPVLTACLSITGPGICYVYTWLMHMYSWPDTCLWHAPNSLRQDYYPRTREWILRFVILFLSRNRFRMVTNCLKKRYKSTKAIISYI